MFLGLTCDELHGPDVLKKLGRMYPTCEPKEAAKEEPSKTVKEESKPRSGSATYDCKKKQKFKKFIPLDTVYERGLLNQDPIQLRYHYMSPTPPQETSKRKISIVCCCYKRNGLQDREKPMKCGNCPTYKQAVERGDPLACIRSPRPFEWQSKGLEICRSNYSGPAVSNNRCQPDKDRPYVGRTFVFNKMDVAEPQKEAKEDTYERGECCSTSCEILIPVYFGKCGCHSTKNRHIYECRRHGSHIHCNEVVKFNPAPISSRFKPVVVCRNPAPERRMSQCLTQFEKRYGPPWLREDPPKIKTQEYRDCEKKIANLCNKGSMRERAYSDIYTGNSPFRKSGSRRPLTAVQENRSDIFSPLLNDKNRRKDQICCFIASGPII